MIAQRQAGLARDSKVGCLPLIEPGAAFYGKLASWRSSMNSGASPLLPKSLDLSS